MACRIRHGNSLFSATIPNPVTTRFVYDGWNLLAEPDGDNNNAVKSSYIRGLDLNGSLQVAGRVSVKLKHLKTQNWKNLGLAFVISSIVTLVALNKYRVHHAREKWFREWSKAMEEQLTKSGNKSESTHRK